MRADGEHTLSEHASKALLAGYGVPVARDALAADAAAAALAAAEIGFPVALKLCGDAITHKTERNLVRLGLADGGAVRAAAGELLALRRPDDGDVALLVAEMVRGRRELIAGVVRDPQFGPCVMLGVGGILAEAVGDVVFAAAPLSAAEARRMIGGLDAGRRLLEAFRGEVYPVNREGGEILGRPCLQSVAEVPERAAELAFVCTPPPANVAMLRACAGRGVRAAFVASGGYGEAGEEGRALERELVRTADELGIVLAGPNGQGVISTPESMCAQMVAPYPPPGCISVASQSGNILSALLNYAVSTGVGVSKAVSTGNSAQTGIADYLAYFAADPETAVALAYLEGVANGRAFIDAVRRLTAAKPLVLLKGGAAAEGQRAAASHTGSLSTDDRVFAGLCRQLGVLRAPTVEHAFEWAASFATQPLPRGRRVIVFTTAGGWGVLAADACVGAGLELVRLPEDIRARVDTMVPSRWSRQNPIDLAGGETRDTIPDALDLVCAHPEVDAVLFLGLGIQSNQAHLFRTGPFFPGPRLDRIADFHERQDRRSAEAAREASERHRKPVLVATELVYADRAYGNAGPLAVREGGRVCYPSAHRAVAALRAMVDYAEFRGSVR